MKYSKAYMEQIRHSRAAIYLSLWAILLQSIFAIDHASALAAASARGGPSGNPLGLIKICTAQGLISILPPAGTGLGEQKPASPPSSENCFVCSVAFVTDAAKGSIAVITIEFSGGMVEAATPPTNLFCPSVNRKGSGTPRGPPVM
ncbi:MAG: hypothetical protein GY927_13470 [bacterium]|nr:hypothetical protein [bacterium]